MAVDVAQSAGETVAAVVENVVAGTEAAVAAAEARAASADALNETLTDAALRDRMSARIDDCEEGIAECQNETQEISGDLQAAETLLTSLSLQLAELSGTVATLLTAQTSSRVPQIPPNSPGTRNPSGAPETEIVITEPSATPETANGDAGGHVAAPTRKSRGRLI